MRSPTRTTSEVTVTLARSVGVAMPSSAACAGSASASRAEIVASVVRIIVITSAEQRRGRLHHLVGGAYHLGVHLVGALRRDQVAHLRDDVDIGLLEASLRDGAVTLSRRGAVLRRAGRRRIGELIAADGLQARLVDETGQADLAENGIARRALQRNRDLALDVDGDARGIVRDRDRRLYRVALCGDDAALIVHLKGAVAGVLVGAVGHQDLEEAFARDRGVEIVAGLRQRALRHAAWRADGLDAAADVDTDGQDGALVGRLGADAADVLVDQVLERRSQLLEAGGA